MSETRGRQASPRTLAIRQMLADTNGELTFSEAEPALKLAGVECDANTFNVTKSQWKLKGQKPVAEGEAPAKAVPEVSPADAVEYVQSFGGLAKAEADLVRRQGLLKAFKAFVKQAQKLAA